MTTIASTPATITSPSNTSPSNTSPSNTSPANTSPANTSPSNTSPSNTSPANTSPANTSPATTTSPTNVPARPRVWRAGLAAAVTASVTTTALAAAASAAGVTFADPTGASIPLAGFTQLTFVFSMLGVGLAALLARRARRPRSTFVRTTVLLTVLSCVPDATFGFDLASAVTLMTLHVVAAVIVVPTLARRLADAR